MTNEELQEYLEDHDMSYEPAPRRGYLDEDSIEVIEDKDGKEVKVAWYMDQDGEELGDVQFELDDYIPKELEF